MAEINFEPFRLESFNMINALNYDQEIQEILEKHMP